MTCGRLHKKEMAESGLGLWTEFVFFPSRHCLESILTFADCEAELSMCERPIATVHVHRVAARLRKVQAFSLKS